jgi:trimeric autotransporter adhesin
MKTKLFLSFLLSPTLRSGSSIRPIFFFILLSFIFYHGEAQVPQGFNYQAIARDGAGHIIINQALPVEITLQTSISGGTIIYKELFSSISSDQFGLISLVVGTGTQTGGTAASFSAIDWSGQALFMKTAVQYPGSTWTTMGTTQVWSVPYSLQAKNVGPLSKLGITGTTTDMEEALFEVKNKTGQTVFAVYNEGIRAYVGNGSAKGVKGGFSVGGYDAAKSSTVYDLLVINTDSSRFYFDSNPKTKGIKGGFSVGGYDMTKGEVRNYLDVTPATTKILTTGTTEGFSVGNASSGVAESYLKLTPTNYMIGHEAGSSITTGLYNSFLGYQSGKANKDGNYNIFIGYHTGINTLGPSGAVGGAEGSYNCFIGYLAGYSNIHGANNTFIGYLSGQMNTSDKNTFLGSSSGLNNSSGYSNTFIGTSAGESNQAGGYNVFLGRSAGANVSNGNWNTCIGTGAGANIKTGEKNVIIGSGAMGENLFAGSGSGISNIVIGFEAGYSASNSSNNIFIGNQAGYTETGSQRLYIANSATATPLVFGEFDNSRVVINGNSTTNALNNTLFVNGSAGGLVSWVSASDRKLKHDIVTIPNALEKVLQLRGVNFLWNDPVPGMDGLQMGFIGQEAEKVVPEVVSVNNDHYSMQYAPITALLVEAVKDQQKQIEDQKQEIDDLKAMVNTLISSKTAGK